jgi:hypothetical protein
MTLYRYELTDTFGGEANYCYVEKGSISVPELTHYGYDGSRGYCKADKAQSREVVRRVKARLGLTGWRCDRETRGDTIVLRPRGRCEIVLIDCQEGEDDERVAENNER